MGLSQQARVLFIDLTVKTLQAEVLPRVANTRRFKKDTPLLIIADFLDENGDEVAAMILRDVHRFNDLKRYTFWYHNEEGTLFTLKEGEGAPAFVNGQLQHKINIFKYRIEATSIEEAILERNRREGW